MSWILQILILQPVSVSKKSGQSWILYIYLSSICIAMCFTLYHPSLILAMIVSKECLHQNNNNKKIESHNTNHINTCNSFGIICSASNTIVSKSLRSHLIKSKHDSQESSCKTSATDTSKSVPSGWKPTDNFLSKSFQLLATRWQHALTNPPLSPFFNLQMFTE